MGNYYTGDPVATYSVHVDTLVVVRFTLMNSAAFLLSSRALGVVEAAGEIGALTWHVGCRCVHRAET